MSNKKRSIEVVDVSLELAYIPFAKASRTFIKQCDNSTEDLWASRPIDDAEVPLIGERDYELHACQKYNSDFLVDQQLHSDVVETNYSLDTPSTSKREGYGSNLSVTSTFKSDHVSGLSREPQSIPLCNRKLGVKSKSNSLNLKYAKMKNDMKRFCQNSCSQLMWPDDCLTTSDSSLSPLFTYNASSCSQAPLLYETDRLIDPEEITRPNVFSDFYETTYPLEQRATERDAVMLESQPIPTNTGFADSIAHDGIDRPVGDTVDFTNVLSDYNITSLQYPPLFSSLGASDLAIANIKDRVDQVPDHSKSCLHRKSSSDLLYNPRHFSGFDLVGSQSSPESSNQEPVVYSLPRQPLESKANEDQYLFLQNLLEIDNKETAELEDESKKNQLFERIHKVGSDIRFSAAASIPRFSSRVATNCDKQHEQEKRLMRQKSRFTSSCQRQSSMNSLHVDQANSEKINRTSGGCNPAEILPRDESTLTEGWSALPTQLLLSETFTPQV